MMALLRRRAIRMLVSIHTGGWPMSGEDDASDVQPGAFRLFDATLLRETTLDNATAAMIHLGADGETIVRVSVSRLVVRDLHGQLAHHMVTFHRPEARSLGDRVARCALATCDEARHWLPSSTLRCDATTA
jgi:hypothetical protein